MLDDATERRVARYVAGECLAPAPGGFTVQLDGRPETAYLLVYAADVAGVEAGGAVLPMRRGGTGERPGWWRDGERVVVRLPNGPRRTVRVTLR